LSLAYAKINLGLFVTEKRPDGYHNIETIFHRIALADRISLEPASSIIVDTDNPALPSGEKNICFRAALLLQQHLSVTTGVKISIQKHIPVGAGLGGGSSDAATVLKELPGFWGRTVDRATLRALAIGLGSDVPFFLGSGSALARGRGEILEYFELDVPYAILLCYPNVHVSTPWAYRQIIPSGPGTPFDLKALVIGGMRNPANLVNDLRNDFEPAVFRIHPEVKEVKDIMARGGALYVSMSGSGSAVYGFFSGTTATSTIEGTLKHLGYATSVTPPHFHVR
jgi:4-diphosphocytidyl-2-C-methyl-D-erythritol kinase